MQDRIEPGSRAVRGEGGGGGFPLTRILVVAVAVQHELLCERKSKRFSVKNRLHPPVCENSY